MISTTLMRILELIVKHDNNEAYNPDEFINCFAYDPNVRRWIACCNDSGYCFIEEFKTLVGVNLYFNTDMSLDEIYDNENNYLKEVLNNVK